MYTFILNNITQNNGSNLYRTFSIGASDYQINTIASTPLRVHTLNVDTFSIQYCATFSIYKQSIYNKHT